jgi:hypothetical protein
LNFTGHAALRLITLLLDFFKRKRAEADAALRFWIDGRVGERFGPRGVDPQLLAIRERYFYLLKQMK